MPLHVSVDFGTSSTCTVVSVDGAEPHVVVIDGQPIVPSAVFAAADGALFVGHEAERQAAVDPARFEPHPKRRIDEGELLLGSSVLRVGDVIRAVLQRAVGEARRYAGGAAVDLLVLTHPADWGAVRTRELRQAASGLGNEVVLVPEPVGAAVFHSAGHGLADGGALAVLDLGGGTVDASVVRKQGPSFRVLATRGDPNFGGADIDQALLDHVGGIVSATDEQAWQRLVAGREMADRRRRRVLRQDVRGAKETLSRHSYTDVPMPPPFSDAHITRSDLERLVAEPLGRAADLVLATLRDGQVPRLQLAGVFLVGGSSRVPMVARLIHERTGVFPTTLDQPETVVARGALRAVRLDPDRTGGVVAAGPSQGLQQPPRPPAQGVPAGQVPMTPSASGTGPPGRAPGQATAGDSLSRASTIVIGGSDLTRPVAAPVATRRRSWTPWWVAGSVGLLVVGVVAAVLVATGDPVGGSRGSQAQATSRQVARYGYHFEYPANWRQGGGDPKLWETRVRPPGDVPSTVVSVRAGEPGYDVQAQRARSVRELRRMYDRKVAGGAAFSGFEADATFAGRRVVHYRQRLSPAVVDWYVVHDGPTRISVGCQYTRSSRKIVIGACEQVVRTVSAG